MILNTSPPSLSKTLDMLNQNQLAIAAGLEEVANWIAQRGSVDVRDNVFDVLKTVNDNAKAVEAGIRAVAAKSD